MTEGDGRRSAVTILIAILALVSYFFICPEPLSPELSAIPVWKTVLPSAGVGLPSRDRPAPGTDTRRIAFSAGNRFAYFFTDGTVAFMAETSGSLALSDAMYITSPASGSGSIMKTPGHEEIETIKDISPFFSSGRLFSAKADGTGVTSFDDEGKPRWSYIFPCQLSAFASSEDLSVGGTVDGWLEGIDTAGKKVFSIAPGGSRLSVVLGAAVSSTGKWVAAISGIDRQRLVVLGRGGADYRVTSHRYLESDFREPVRIVIMDDETHVLYRRNDGVGVWSVDGKVDGVLPVKADDFDVSMDAAHGVSMLAARQGNTKSITIFRTPSTVLGTIQLPDSSEYIRILGSSVFIGTRTWIARLDLVEN